jgi:hypothetical protein
MYDITMNKLSRVLFYVVDFMLILFLSILLIFFEVSIYDLRNHFKEFDKDDIYIVLFVGFLMIIA